MREGGSRKLSLFAIPKLIPNGPAAAVGLVLGARAGVHAPVSVCASGAEAIALGFDLLRADRADVVVCGGAEASLLPLLRALGAAADSVPVSATKSMTGHLLGASGALEAVITVLSISALAPPTLNLDNQDDDVDLDVVRWTPRPLCSGKALSSSCGFGGHNVSLTGRLAAGNQPGPARGVSTLPMVDPAATAWRTYPAPLSAPLTTGQPSPRPRNRATEGRS
jgi:3-oxoacyl-(acyl-carrier-protein) synthase